MLIYLIMILWIIITFFLFNKKSKKLYCTLSAISMLLVLMLRKSTFAKSDIIYLYLPAFESIKNMSWNNIIANFSDTDIFFYLLMKVFNIFSNDFNLFCSLLSIPFIYSFTKFIYRYSKNCCISFLILLSFNYFFLSFITLRHSLATAFVVLSLINLLEKNNKNFFLFLIIGTLFHKTAIIFIVAYFIRNMTFKPKLVFLIIITSFLLTILMGDTILTFVFNHIFNEGHYSLYAKTNNVMNLNTFLINFILLILCILYRKKKENANQKYDLYFNLFTIGTAISIFTIKIDVAYRLALFFTISEIILIPNIISEIKNSQQKILLQIMLSTFLIFFMFYSTISNLKLENYMFFWE